MLNYKSKSTYMKPLANYMFTSLPFLLTMSLYTGYDHWEVLEGTQTCNWLWDNQVEDDSNYFPVITVCYIDVNGHHLLTLWALSLMCAPQRIHLK